MRVLFTLIALVGVFGPTVRASQAPAASDAPGSVAPGPVSVGPGQQGWPDEVVESFALLPVQEGGRVKPLDTLAGFKLLKLNAKRSLVLADDVKIDSMEWLLECLFFPERARRIECFLVRNGDVLIAAGLEVQGKKKSDRYSYDELLPGRPKLFERAGNALRKEPAQRDTVETQTLQLATNMREFEELVQGLEFARDRLPADGSAQLREIFEGAATVRVSEALAHAPELTELMHRIAADRAGMADADAGLSALLHRLEMHIEGAGHLLVVFPPDPAADDQDTWISPGEIVMRAFDPEATELEAPLRALALFEQLVDARDDPAAFTGLAQELESAVVGIAREHDEYGSVPLEVRFYQGDYFTRGLVFFLLAFLLMAFSWLRSSVWLTRGVWLSLLAGTGFTVVGIVLRCIIRARPPVLTLYDTILFITACAVIVCMIIERMNRQGVGLLLAPLFGVGGLFLSMKYELKEAVASGDTMTSVIAVLDTNFWLATHVTTVTLGYSAGLLAAALAHLWLFGQMLGIRVREPGLYRSIARMTYGVVCFGLLFSIVGTILGGVWANYSWGRFWGWDPKENGALLIVLWELLMLHARLGGYVRDFGFALLAIFGGVVVAFSWWGVNLLGVGLHSYGFTSGVQTSLTVFYVIEALVLIGAGAWWLGRRASASASASPGAEA
jgi:ABC-type transport system involved in cytochrome c biogenesis permease subunit